MQRLSIVMVVQLQIKNIYVRAITYTFFFVLEAGPKVWMLAISLLALGFVALPSGPINKHFCIEYLYI